MFWYSWFRYPGSTFMDHVLRYQDTPGIKMIVVLGEVGITQIPPIQSKCENVSHS